MSKPIGVTHKERKIRRDLGFMEDQKAICERKLARLKPGETVRAKLIRNFIAKADRKIAQHKAELTQFGGAK